MGAPSNGDSVTIHSSWRGIVGSSLGAALLAVAGTFGVASVGFRVVPGTLFVAGWLAVTVMTLDYPVAATFTSEGVSRRMMLRRQWFAWVEVTQLTRTRPSLIRVDRKVEHGGLALVKGRRRYLLVDRSEGADEFDELVEVIERGGEDVGTDLLLRPAAGVSPTWLYRRHHWRPESADGR